MPLFHYTPNVILAAIIITAVIGLIDYQAAFRLWKVDKLDFLACVCSFVGVLFISVPLGLAIAVSLSYLKHAPSFLATFIVEGITDFKLILNLKEETSRFQ